MKNSSPFFVTLSAGLRALMHKDHTQITYTVYSDHLLPVFVTCISAHFNQEISQYISSTSSASGLPLVFHVMGFTG